MTIARTLSILVALMCLFEEPTVAANDTIPAFERVRLLETGRQIQDAELVNHENQKFRISELRGQVALILFGFTKCPDVCPMTMARWRDLENSGELELQKVAFVLISVDGERDTPAVMKDYLQRFSDRFIGLTGDPAEIRLIAKQFSAAFYKATPSGIDGQYTVSHSPQAYVLDPAGNLRAEFYDPSPKAMAGVIQALLAEAADT